VTLDERLVIRPVFRIRETGGSPASLAFSGEQLRQTLFVNERDVTPVVDANQLSKDSRASPVQ